MNRILIDVESYMSSLSLIEDGRLKEYYVEYNDSHRLTGNIYKGRVVNVLHGLQTAFVNIGLNRNGFLYVGETLDHKSVLCSSGVMPQQLHVKEGDYVMVQVTKEETGQKGARLTMNVSLPGRYVVYLPTIDFVGVSNKITDPDTRERLTKLLTKYKPKGGGLIARTICLEAKKSEIIEEIRQIYNMYRGIVNSYEDAGDNITLVHTEGNLLVRMVRDMLSTDVESIICNDSELIEELKERLTKTNSRFVDRLQLFESEYDIADVYGTFDDVDKLLERKIELPSGGSLVIEHTEALTAIDVNTGKFRGDSDHENTVYKTNLEAAVEIARQLRLRNIGGIIVVDFIDMVETAHKKDVVEALRKEMVFDRTKSRVLDMTDLGLVEITRKKVGSELGQILLSACPTCHGDSHTPSGDYIARKIKCKLKRLFADGDFAGALVTVHTSLFEHMFTSGFFSEACETAWADKRIYMVPSDSIRPDQFTISGVRTAMMHLPPLAKLLY